MKRDTESGILFASRKALSPNATVLLVHGMGGHTDRWDFLAKYLQKNGISSYSLELRGFGSTPDRKGHIEAFDVYFDDILRLKEIIAGENPGLDIFLIGESMGGLICFAASYLYPGFFKGLICISPAFGNRIKFKAADYFRVFTSLLINSKKQHEIPFTSEMCTRDVAYQKVMDADEREHRLASSSLLWEIIKWQMKSGSGKLRKNFQTDLLFLLSSRDMLVNPKASKAVFDNLKLEAKKIIEYPEMYHALSIDVGREAVFEDIRNWIENRV